MLKFLPIMLMTTTIMLQFIYNSIILDSIVRLHTVSYALIFTHYMPGSSALIMLMRKPVPHCFGLITVSQKLL